MLYTAQYRYAGRDRLDITVRGNCLAGKLYAPTWDMVNDLKSGRLSKEAYADKYFDLLIDRYKTSADAMHRLVKIVKDDGRDITLVCFCAPGAFCHRHLMVNFFAHNWSVEYGGERTVAKK